MKSEKFVDNLLSVLFVTNCYRALASFTAYVIWCSYNDCWLTILFKLNIYQFDEKHMSTHGYLCIELGSICAVLLKNWTLEYCVSSIVTVYVVCVRPHTMSFIMSRCCSNALWHGVTRFYCLISVLNCGDVLWALNVWFNDCYLYDLIIW